MKIKERLSVKEFHDLASIVYSERCNQQRKWGVQEHHVYKWLVILGEELGEAFKAGLEWVVQNNDEHREKLRRELMQVAAVAMAILSGLTEEERDG